jgi:hypothetical protein
MTKIIKISFPVLKAPRKSSNGFYVNKFYCSCPGFFLPRLRGMRRENESSIRGEARGKVN